MKKISYKFFITLSLFVVLSACQNSNSNSNSNTNTISVSALTDREITILSTTSDKSFVFDFDTGGEYKEVSLWIEKYEAGELIEGQLSEMTTQINEKGSIVISNPNITNAEKTLAFNIGIGDNGGTSSSSIYDTHAMDLEHMASVWGSFSGELPLSEDEFVLAYIGYSNDKSGMRSLTTDFYQNPQSHINELKAYDVAYLFKAKFIK